jgi:DNA-directed RNA polymerase subunit alpha
MTKETAHAPAAARDLSPLDLLKGDLDHARINQFKQQVFRSVSSVEKLRDWARGPTASGLQRGLALWAIGRHADAAPLLAQHKSSSAVANCLAQSYIALGRLDDAEELLGARQRESEQAITWLRVLEARGDAAALAKGLAKVQSILPPADQRFFAGRVKELEHDTEAAIALYDEALAHDENHTNTLFRLALNVDLRGEDEEARELYERALMVPPVNVACVMNLGILYEDMGNYRRAMQCFDLALQADPENERARMFRRDANAALNMYYDEDQERREDRRNKILRTPINDFELSVRSRNCLTNMNIRTLGDLVKKSEAELLSYKNFGETSLMEIKEILRIKGLRLGMGVDDLMHRDIGEPEPAAVSPDEMPDPNSPDPSRRPVTELDLSVRSRRVVDLLKIRTIGDLANKTEAELLACPNFGQTSLNEIKTKLDDLGLALRG